MNYIELGVDEIDLIRDMWEQLNSHHHEKSEYFKDHFQVMSFEDRKVHFDKKENLRCFCYRTDTIKGYCLASISEGKGEIESLYLAEELRGEGVGDELMNRALNWIKDCGITDISVVVAEGNEDAISFYNRFNFQKKCTVLKMTN